VLPTHGNKMIEQINEFVSERQREQLADSIFFKAIHVQIVKIILITVFSDSRKRRKTKLQTALLLFDLRSRKIKETLAQICRLVIYRNVELLLFDLRSRKIYRKLSPRFGI
jgi:hypothetical protein